MGADGSLATGMHDSNPPPTTQKILWSPPETEHTATHALARKVVETKGGDSAVLSYYSNLHKWSVDHVSEFWDLVWELTGVIGSKGLRVVDEQAKPADNPDWFPDTRLNWAENLLWCRDDSRTALIQVAEPTDSNDTSSIPHKSISYGDLYKVVRSLVSALLEVGIKPGDRIASYSSNCIENVAACLATSAIGAIWLSASADFGAQGVIERFEQVQPKLIFAIDSVIYNAKEHDNMSKIHALLAGLKESNITPTVVVIPLHSSADKRGWEDDWIHFTDFTARGDSSKLGASDSGEIEWKRLSFNWPLWILFSSGTTGRPKPIVHRAGGMLLQAKKELQICAELKSEDIFFYYTTVAWMMWNWLIGGLAVGATLVLYDGSPLRDPSFLWRMVHELKVTRFGTSAKYLDQLAKKYKPGQHNDLSTLKHIYSTGSPLAPSQFDYVYDHIKSDVILASITGGTDICSLFAGIQTSLPVIRGELQCKMLGMAVDTFSPDGRPITREPGELVCTRPFPCQPLGFWPLSGFGYADPEVKSAQDRYKASYYEQFPSVWFHGDHVLITPEQQGNGGGLVMLGRSDGVLNPGGVRFGSAELYDVLESDDFPQLADCLAVGQMVAGGTDERVVLFVQLVDDLKLGEELEDNIRKSIRARRSARHVPARIIQVREIPYTVNGKRVEVPVKKIINGAPVSSVNAATLRNPECLEEYVDAGSQLREEEQ